MNLQHRVQVGKVKQVAHQPGRSGTLQAHVPILRPALEQGQFAYARAIHGSNSTEVEHQLARLRQNFRKQARERGRLIAINDAALAVNDHHAATISMFQTQLQFRLLR